MCLAIPMKIVKIDGESALVKTGGLVRKANISFIRSPRVGDYILLHAGFAIEKVKELEALKTLNALKKIRL
jgi:hydrogenase expression/formation protein HypC